MLRSDFSHEAHANFQNYYFLYTMCYFSSTLTSNRRQFHVIEVQIESNFHFIDLLDVFNHFNAPNIKNKIILGL